MVMHPFLDPETLLFQPVEGEPRNLKADCIVIATGSIAKPTKDIRMSLPGVFNSDTIRQIHRIPKTMVVKGGGIIAVEYANIFALLGSRVIIVHQSGKLLKHLDKDLQKALVRDLEDSNVEIILNTEVKEIQSGSPSPSGLPSLLVDIGDAVLECDSFLVATGRHGATRGLGLENLEHLGMKISKKDSTIEVDELQRTGVGSIYACGDVVGANLATKGQAQATRVINHHFGSGSEIADQQDEKEHPCGVWTIPEVAWVGMTEQEAQAANINYGTARAEYSTTMRGMVKGQSGFLKLIFGRDHPKVLGVHICGSNACDLITYGAEIIHCGFVISDILYFIFPAVTYHELYHVAATKASMYLASGGRKSLSKQATMSDAICAVTAWNRLHVAFTKSGISEQELHDAFNAFDTDGSGLLNEDELHRVLELLNFHVSKEVIKEMIDNADDSKDHALDYNEFRCAVGA